MDDMLSVMSSYCSQPTEGQEDEGRGKFRERERLQLVQASMVINPLTTLDIKRYRMPSQEDWQ